MIHTPQKRKNHKQTKKWTFSPSIELSKYYLNSKYDGTNWKIAMITSTSLKKIKKRHKTLFPDKIIIVLRLFSSKTKYIDSFDCKMTESELITMINTNAIIKITDYMFEAIKKKMKSATNNHTKNGKDLFNECIKAQKDKHCQVIIWYNMHELNKLNDSSINDKLWKETEKQFNEKKKHFDPIYWHTNLSNCIKKDVTNYIQKLLQIERNKSKQHILINGYLRSNNKSFFENVDIILIILKYLSTFLPSLNDKGRNMFSDCCYKLRTKHSKNERYDQQKLSKINKTLLNAKWKTIKENIIRSMNRTDSIYFNETFKTYIKNASVKYVNTFIVDKSKQHILINGYMRSQNLSFLENVNIILIILEYYSVFIYSVYDKGRNMFSDCCHKLQNKYSFDPLYHHQEINKQHQRLFNHIKWNKIKNNIIMKMIKLDSIYFNKNFKTYIKNASINYFNQLLQANKSNLSTLINGYIVRENKSLFKNEMISIILNYCSLFIKLKFLDHGMINHRNQNLIVDGENTLQNLSKRIDEIFYDSRSKFINYTKYRGQKVYYQSSQPSGTTLILSVKYKIMKNLERNLCGIYSGKMQSTYNDEEYIEINPIYWSMIKLHQFEFHNYLENTLLVSLSYTR